jgi:hypothetical protein
LAKIAAVLAAAPAAPRTQATRLQDRILATWTAHVAASHDVEAMDAQTEPLLCSLIAFAVALVASILEIESVAEGTISISPLL